MATKLESSLNRLPEDVAVTIAGRLEAEDVCSLGSCSRFWRQLCLSDCVWLALSKQRWPSLASGSDPVAADLVSQGWRRFYINKHRKMAASASSVIKFVEQSCQNESLEVGYYLKAIGSLCSMDLGFKDVQLFLFTRKCSVLLNLIGLHYSILWLGIPHEYVMEALESHQISQRRVCVSWFKLGRWIYGFRLPDESHTHKVSLGELTMAKEEPILSVLIRGAVHEVLRVQIISLPSREIN